MSIIDFVIGKNALNYGDVKITVNQILKKTFEDHPESEEILNPETNHPELQKLKHYIIDDFLKSFNDAAKKKDPDYYGFDRKRAEKDLEESIELYFSRKKFRTENRNKTELMSYKDLLSNGFKDSTSHAQDLRGTIEFRIHDLDGNQWVYYVMSYAMNKVVQILSGERRRDIGTVKFIDEAFKLILSNSIKRNEKIRKRRLRGTL